jgi:hypothetical protein
VKSSVGQTMVSGVTDPRGKALIQKAMANA